MKQFMLPKITLFNIFKVIHNNDSVDIQYSKNTYFRPTFICFKYEDYSKSLINIFCSLDTLLYL